MYPPDINRTLTWRIFLAILLVVAIFGLAVIIAP